MKTIEIDSHTAALGNALGLTVYASDGILDLTPKGEAWLREWLRRKLDEINGSHQG